MTNRVRLRLLANDPVGQQSERQLVARARTGDADALERLYVLHVDRVWGYVFTTVRNHHDAEELTHDVFVRMLEHIDRHQWRDLPFSAWLLRIAHNAAVDRLRRRGYAVADATAWEPEAPSAEEEAMRAVMRTSLGALLDELTLAQRQTLVLRFYCGLSLRETAAIQGRSLAAVKLLQQRALAALARRRELVA